MGLEVRTCEMASLPEALDCFAHRDIPGDLDRIARRRSRNVFFLIKN